MSRNVRVAGSGHEEGEIEGLIRFALFTACSTAFSMILGTSFLLTPLAVGMVAWETAWQ